LVAGDERLQNLPSLVLERAQRAGLVPLHEPAIADDIGRENGSETACHGVIGHLQQPPWDFAVDRILSRSP
jgi:hypothetical protein